MSSIPEKSKIVNVQGGCFSMSSNVSYEMALIAESVPLRWRRCGYDSSTLHLRSAPSTWSKRFTSDSFTTIVNFSWASIPYVSCYIGTALKLFVSTQGIDMTSTTRSEVTFSSSSKLESQGRMRSWNHFEWLVAADLF